MNNVYFGNEGMTSTTANYYANIAKELMEAANNRLNSVKFYDTSIALIGSSEKQIMTIGNRDLDFIFKDLQTIASMNAFCAWVREAIKEKDNQQRELNDMDMEDWAKQQGIEIPVSPKFPRDPKLITEQDVINSWDINKRNKYLRLEAFAASFGKYIHPGGAYSKAREDAHKALNNMITKTGEGRETVLYYKKPSVDIEDVDSTFLKLQEIYRGYEKELNQMKAEIKDKINELTRERYNIFREEVAECKKLQEEHNSRMSELRNEFATWGTNELEKISKLKITIPDGLKDTFNTIKEVGDTSK